MGDLSITGILRVEEVPISIRSRPVYRTSGVLVNSTECVLADLLPLASAMPTHVKAGQGWNPVGASSEDGVQDIGEIEQGIIPQPEMHLTPTRVDVHRARWHRTGPEDAASREQIGQAWRIQVPGVEVMDLDLVRI